jgi:glycerol transport system ATP-binding protein
MGHDGRRYFVATIQDGPSRSERCSAKVSAVPAQSKRKLTLSLVTLELHSVCKQVNGTAHLYELNLALAPGAINVLLGRTLAGKTSLMRIMAGLDQPSAGRILVDGRDVTGIKVRDRNLAMVYQQFINYPTLSVFENIASPLKLQRRTATEIKKRVGEIAETLRLTPHLDRKPSELSGGQQQRTALARALAKEAQLLLLDEPLVNLDYKLREELRSEFAQLFKDGKTTVVYATTEPHEALQLGGHTAVLDAGRLLQFGPTLETFRRPTSLAAAHAFSDPPLNILTATDLSANALPQILAAHDRHELQLGIRSHEIQLQRRHARDIEISGRVDLAEISGSETYLHVSNAQQTLVAQLAGVHDLDIGANCTLFIDPQRLYGFDRRGDLLFAPGGA